VITDRLRQKDGRQSAEERQQIVGGWERQLVSRLHGRASQNQRVRGPDQSVLEGAHPCSLFSTSRTKEQREVCILASADVGKKFH